MVVCKDLNRHAFLSFICRRSKREAKDPEKRSGVQELLANKYKVSL